MNDKRVVITGMGTINPLGDNPETYYKNLLAGRSGIKKWRSIDLDNIECKIGGDLADEDGFNGKKALQEFLPYFPESSGKKIKKMFRSTTFSAQVAMICTMQAARDGGLFQKGGGLSSDLDPFRVSVPVAGHNFNSNYIFENLKQFTKDPDYIDPLSSVDGIDPNLPAVVTETFGLHGPAFNIGGACASGNLALRLGYRDIISGECDLSFVVGPLFDVSPADIQASVILNAVVVKPEYQDKPELASRPFDRQRCGFLYSHGSATLILEELQHALDRGAPIYGELLGVIANSNANHLPMPSVPHQVRAMKEAIKMAEVEPQDIDYVNCHATGTPDGDIQELHALQQVFDKHIYKLKMNAPKSMLGHTCWASPLVETVGALMQMKNGILHPTINLDDPDPELDGMDLCANKTQEHQIEIFMKNSFGFGGINCCSIIRRYQ